MNLNIPAGLGQPFPYSMQQPVGGATQPYPIPAQHDTSYQHLKPLSGNFVDSVIVTVVCAVNVFFIITNAPDITIKNIKEIIKLISRFMLKAHFIVMSEYFVWI